VAGEVRESSACDVYGKGGRAAFETFGMTRLLSYYIIAAKEGALNAGAIPKNSIHNATM
jgi:hypothetical protein